MNLVMFCLVVFLQFFLFLFQWTELAKPKYPLALMMAVLYLGNMLIYGIFVGTLGIPQVTVIVSGLQTTLTYLFVWFTFYGTRRERIRLLLVNAVSTGTIDSLLCLLMWLMYGKSPAELNGPSEVLTAGQIMSVDMLLIAIGITVMLLNRKKEGFDKVRRYFAVIPAYGVLHFIYLLLYYLSLREEPSSTELFQQFLLQLMLTFLLIIFYRMIKWNMKKRDAEELLRQMETSMQSTHEYYQLAHEKFEEISQIRHDFRNQMQTVERLIAEGHPREAQESAALIQNALEETRLPQYCPNPVIDSLLTVKLNQPENRGIRTEILLQDIDHLPLDPYEMCSVFSNLLDNAFAAACADGISEEMRFVSVRSGIVQQMMLLKVKNACSPDVSLTAHKKDGHGYGLHILRMMTEKHGGTFRITKDGQTVTAIIAFPVHQAV